MEEEGKTIVTRLRRRLSVEADDVGSPATPLTPTKKRVGRLAAKPVLDNIDENAPVNSPRATRRRSTAKDVVEEEKMMTPSKRSARIRSNTSLTLDTTQNVDSPRARRALRRNSQAGSDTEVAVTPVKQTRRTRKDSTSSIENLVEAVAKPAKQITEETIAEEPESPKSVNNSINESISPNSVRKSRRIAAKKDRNSLNKSDTETNTNVTVAKGTRKSRSKESVDEDIASNDVIQDSDTKNADVTEQDNKSSKKKTHTRAKSWTDETNDKSFLGVKDSVKTYSNRSFNKDSKSNNALVEKVTEKPEIIDDKENIEVSLNSSKSKKKNTLKKLIDTPNKSDTNPSPKKLSNEKSEGEDMADCTSQSNNSQGVESLKLLNAISNENVDVKIIVEVTSSNTKITEKHDPNPISPGKESDPVTESIDTDDQCVPVINHELNYETTEIKGTTKQTKDNQSKSGFGFGIFSALNKSREKKSSVNDSCEPMDIDETLPENVSILDQTNESLIIETKKSRQSKTPSKSENTNITDLTISQTVADIDKERSRKSKTPSVSEDNKGETSLSQSFTNINTATNKTISQTKERSRKSKTPSISENNAEETSLSQSVTNIDENISQTKERSRKSKTPSISEDNKKETSLSQSFTNIDENISQTKERSRKSKTPSISEDNKKETSLSQSIANIDKSIDKNISQTKERSRKSKTPSISEENKNEISLSQLVAPTPDKSLSPKESRKSLSVTNDKSIGHDLEKSSNSNKSTLILSQIKDDSAVEKNESKSSKHFNKETINNISNVLEVSKGKVVKNNNSFTQESTETPLKNKKLQKLGMQTSTPVLTSNNQKIEKLETSKNISLASNKSKKNDSTSSEEDIAEQEGDNSEDESDNDASGFTLDQAEDAGDDYESGDSQDESEREYEDQNQIRERGETLTSEEEISNDSEYEKDSFIVSSDEEDNELMSGTGDDLSMTDNELTMSAKSKKKFNERKLKEQKKASREMFEARHNKKNKSTIEDSSDDEASKPVRKNNRQRLDSTLLASGDDSIAKSKKNKSRLDSSHDVYAQKSDNDESIIKPKKNKMRLDSSHETSVKSDGNQSKSKNNKSKLFDDSAIIEQEISTAVNESIIHKNDPLITAIKTETKTPQKLDLSTVNISVRPDVEEIHMRENASMVLANETCDPLQATLAFDEEYDDSDDSSSGNEEIIQNYDSMLKDLNKDEGKKISKNKDMSLNLNKKEKLKANPIVEQLNLTITRKEQKRKSSVTITKSNDKVDMSNDDSSSDSLDLKLLFPNDSDNNEDGEKGNKNNKEENAEEDFIPLKRTEAKTNLRENLDGVAANISLNKTPQKKNKKLSESMTEQAVDVSLLKTPGSKKKKNKKRASESSVFTESEQTDVEKQETSFLKTPGSNKKNTKKPSISVSEEDLKTVEVFNASNSAKKTKRTSECSAVNVSVDQLSTSINKTPGSAKNKNKKLSESLTNEPIASPDEKLDISSSSNKKNRKVSESLANDTTATETVAEDSSSKKRKRKSSLADEIVLNAAAVLENAFNAAGDGVQSKKLKLSKNDASATKIETEAESASTENNTEKINQNLSKKKKKNLAHHEVIQNIPENLKPKSKKRKERDDDNSIKQTKVRKENYFDNLAISRLPSSVLEQLDEKPKTKKIVATSAFAVEEIVKRKNKPSQYLEESIYLNSDSPEVKKNRILKVKPKVLPFVPTASTSGSGFTTNFQVNVIAKDTKFVAQASNMPNFKTDYINEKIKKMGTYEMYRKQRNVKMSKF